MSYSKKHSKIKNTAILFELLTRQITVDVINNTDSKAVKILKEFFSPKTQLGKENDQACRFEDKNRRVNWEKLTVK